MATKESWIKVVLAGEFRNKGFKQADTAINKLTGSAKRLAGTLGLAFGTAAILGYAKASVKAAAADIKAQKQLTLALNNLGLARDASRAEAYVQSLQKEFGVVDDLLRPAYAQLARATGNAYQAQKLLQLSLDISASTGIGLEATVKALSRAYLGNNASLSKLGIGISKADLKAKSFVEITDQLTDKFRGSAKLATEDFAGSMDKLAVTSANVKELIGEGIIDSLKILAGDKSIDNATADMEKYALSIADVIRGSAKAASELEKLWNKLPATTRLRIFPLAAPLDLLGQLGKAQRKFPGGTPGAVTGKFPSGIPKQTKAEKDRLALLKKQLDVEKKAALLAKAKLSLSKAAGAFDLTKISIAAALKGKIDKETELRLLAMQAIENDNGELALKFLGQLATLQKDNDLAKLAGITTIGDAQLASLNTNLLKELNFINQSKLAQADKDAAIQAAFGRYNASIKEAGGLADAASYSARTQELQNLVLKVASIETGKNSAITANGILESAQDGSIKRVASAQALADNARMAALMAYVAALNSIGKGGVGGFIDPDAEAAARRRASIGATGPSPGFGGKRAHEDNFFDAPTSVALNPEGNPNRGGIPPATINVTITAPIITNPDAIVDIVQDAMQQVSRRGGSSGFAGMIAI